MRKILILFLTVLVLSGCATHTIPPYSEEQTLLVIPKSNENNSLESWFRKYYVVLESLDKELGFEPVKIWLNNNDESYVVVDSIPEGSYAIKSIKWRVNSGWRSSRAMDEGYKVFIPINVVKGEISMPLYRFIVKQESRGSMAYSSINYENYYKTSTDEITKSIAELENGPLWAKGYEPLNQLLASNLRAKKFESRNQLLASNCGAAQETKVSRKIYNAYMLKALNKILGHFDAPLKDGNSYQGEISLIIDMDGYINEFILSKPSGHKNLDISLMNAVKKTSKIELPEDKCAIDLLTKRPLKLFYDETDMK